MPKERPYCQNHLGSRHFYKEPCTSFEAPSGYIVRGTVPSLNALLHTPCRDCHLGGISFKVLLGFLLVACHVYKHQYYPLQVAHTPRLGRHARFLCQ